MCRLTRAVSDAPVEKFSAINCTWKNSATQHLGRAPLGSTRVPHAPTDCSIRLELVLVVDLERRVLLGLAQHAIADDEKLDLVAHETAESILGRADDRLAAHVEAGIDQDATTSLLLEARDQGVEARVGV